MVTCRNVIKCLLLTDPHCQKQNVRIMEMDPIHNGYYIIMSCPALEYQI